QRVLAAAPEHERVATLEPQHAAPLAGERDQPLADVGLRRRGLAAALAGELELRARSGEFKHALVDERVVDDDFGLRKTGERVEGQQSGIARAGAGEPDMSRRERRVSAPQGHEGIVCAYRHRLSHRAADRAGRRPASEPLRWTSPWPHTRPILLPTARSAAAGPPAPARRRPPRRPTRRLSLANFPTRWR